MGRIVRCSNEYCYHNTDGICKEQKAISKIFKDNTDTVYIEVFDCEDKINDQNKEDPFWYDRMLFEVYMQQEADGYFNK